MKISIAVSLSALCALACSKQVNPDAFDAGATAAPVVASAAPSVAETASAAPLASLAPTPSAPVAQAKPKPKVDPQECVDARRFCNHPAAAKDAAIQNLCKTNKESCFAKGGKL